MAGAVEDDQLAARQLGHPAPAFQRLAPVVGLPWITRQGHSTRPAQLFRLAYPRRGLPSLPLGDHRLDLGVQVAHDTVSSYCLVECGSGSCWSKKNSIHLR